MLLEKADQQIKTGNEKLILNCTELNHTLFDFWRWSVSDILSNATRGKFAEFIVATATSIDLSTLREEWGEYDLETPDGIKLEIKSSAFLQSWVQRTYSTISFSIKQARLWDYLINKYTTDKKRHADIYVFCLLHHKNKKTVNPLNLNQWVFYVLSTKELNEYPRSQHSITLNSLQKLTNAITYENLNQHIKEKYNSYCT